MEPHKKGEVVTVMMPNEMPEDYANDASALAYVITKINDEITNVEPIIDEPVRLPSDKNIEIAALKMVRLNYTDEEIFTTLQADYALDDSQTRVILSKAKSAIKREYKKYVKQIAETNINILHQMLHDSVEVNDRKTALSIIQELNKMCALYTDKQFIQNNIGISSPSGEQIKITFGQ